MVRLTKRTAIRSVEALLKTLPADAVIEVTRSGQTPPGLGAVVRIEISGPPDGYEPQGRIPDELETAGDDMPDPPDVHFIKNGDTEVKR